MTLLGLATPELAVQIDPARGGVITSAVARRADVELLFQAPWPAGPLDVADLDEDAWTTAWQGGWNLLFPNAGADCEIGGIRHPFHGAASITPWAVLETSASTVRLHWEGADGLAVQREISVVAGTLRVENAVTNDGPRPAPFILVEHLILGADVLGPSTRVRIETASVTALANEGHRLNAAKAEWPLVVREEATEDWSVRPPAGTARFGALQDVLERVVLVDVPDRDLRLRLSWSEGFPHVWFWEERACEISPPWMQQAVCLGLEPSTSATGEGLAAALQRGDAAALEPGAEAHTSVELEVTT
jgi:galactose mutarotase-like enzyme